jgi:hypothetical protein
MAIRKAHLITASLLVSITWAAWFGYGYFKSLITYRYGRSITGYSNKHSVNSIAIGNHLPQLHGRTISQDDIVLNLAAQKHGTLILVLSPVCPYCRVNFHNWREVVKVARHDQVVWVDITNTADSTYLSSVGILPSENLILLEDKECRRLGLVVTPTTILVDSHGIIKWLWSGLMNDKQVNQLRSLLAAM